MKKGEKSICFFVMANLYCYYEIGKVPYLTERKEEKDDGHYQPYAARGAAE